MDDTPKPSTLTTLGVGEDFDQDELAEALTYEAALSKVTDLDAWTRFKDLAERKIEAYRTGSVIEEPLAADNVKVGEAFKVAVLVATELQDILNTVESADKAVKNEQARKKK